MCSISLGLCVRKVAGLFAFLVIFATTASNGLADSKFNSSKETAALKAKKASKKIVSEFKNPNQVRIKKRDAKINKHQKGHHTKSHKNKNKRHNFKNKKRRSSILFLENVRTINGEGNNIANPDWGKADTAFTRLANDSYLNSEDMTGTHLKSPREISNLCVAMPQVDDIYRPNVSDMLWQWGQFLDHDLDLTPEIDPHEEANISVPNGDPWFDSGGTGTQEIPFSRSLYVLKDGRREQVNLITAYIDASNVYGSDEERANALRLNDGSGQLKTGDNNLLPFNTVGLANAPSAAPNFFLAGDFRANEQSGLTAMHTLFMREHNRLANVIRKAYPSISGDEVYEFARALVAAEMQVITYNEFLPTLLGKRALPAYNGYRANVNAAISNEFATAAYRFGHTMLSPEILRLNSNGEPISTGHLSLRDAFFNPNELINTGIDPILRGLASQRAQRIDVKLVDDVRNVLFGQPGAGGLDLASLNIQRGRDHGLASYAKTRKALGLKRKRGFRQVASTRQGARELRSAYGKVNNIELWVGGLSEPAYKRGLVGETFHAILVDQFVRLRDGDRFWYENYLPKSLSRWASRQSLAKIIRRNTSINNIQKNVFKVPGKYLN